MSYARSADLNKIKIIVINDKNLEVYINLARCYEAEFSSITYKLPNETGIFEPDTLPVEPYAGYILYKNEIPIGFCLIEISKQYNDIAEFYIIPSMRKNMYGYSLAASIFEMYPGNWQVRQIEGAEAAKSFWRSVITKFTNNNYSETVVSDPDWGIVTRQHFLSDINKRKKNDADKSSFFAVSVQDNINEFSLLHTPSIDQQE